MKYPHKWRSVVGVGTIVLLGVAGYLFFFHDQDDRPAVPTPVADEMIQIDTPLPEASVTSPLRVTGRARGTWFFEATFPIVLTDWDGRIIATTHATALSDWMTTDWVPFEATIVFTPDTKVSNRGALILKKDNPSGDPAREDSLHIPVSF